MKCQVLNIKKFLRVLGVDGNIDDDDDDNDGDGNGNDDDDDGDGNDDGLLFRVACLWSLINKTAQIGKGKMGEA